MFITVSGNEFISKVSRLIPSSGRTLINFSVINGVLNIQVIANMVCASELSIKESHGEDYGDITVTASQALLLVDSEEDVNIDVQKDLVVITQREYVFQATREWEQKYKMPVWEEDNSSPMDDKEFKALLQNVRAFDAMARVIKEPMADVSFTDGKCVAGISNLVLVQQCSFSGFKLSADAARNLGRILDVNCKYIVNKEKGFVLIKTKYKLIHCMTMPIDKRQVSSIDAKVKELKPVATISLSELSSKIDALQRVYKEAKVNFAITERGLRLQVSDSKTTFSYGDRNTIMKTMQFTIIHLGVINKIYNSLTGIKISAGGNILCLSHNSVQLLMSGTLY